MLKHNLIFNLYLFKSFHNLKKRPELCFKQIFEKFKLGTKVKINLDGDSLYKIKVKMFNGIIYNQGIIENIKKVLNMLTEVLLLKYHQILNSKK